MKRIGCLIYYYGEKYQELGRCAKNSFIKHHPDVDFYHVGDDNSHLYDASNYVNTINGGAYKYLLAAEIMKKNQYDKMIVLGADTITTSRLDEFIDDDNHDLLVTLDYPYQLSTARVKSPDAETHLNADVICFNNIKPIIDIIKLTPCHPTYNEQGALNEIVWSDKYNYTHNIIDGPYNESSVVYNARAKGNITAGPGEKPWKEHTNKFYVKDDKLYTGDHKQIKVWHYCEGFGSVGDNRFKQLVNFWISDWFNEDTKRFFKEHCDCDDFFEKEFSF
jgi:hypothetical protein